MFSSLIFKNMKLICGFSIYKNYSFLKMNVNENFTLYYHLCIHLSWVYIIHFLRIFSKYVPLN